MIYLINLCSDEIRKLSHRLQRYRQLSSLFMVKAKMVEVINEVFGDNLTANRFIKKIKPFDSEHFIFTSAKFYGSNRLKTRLGENGIHEYVDHSGRIMLDSGGYQLITKNRPLTLEETVEIYRLASFKRLKKKK